jgi:hypothetical protein
VNLAGVRVLFELEERLGMRILETLYDERTLREDEIETATAEAPAPGDGTPEGARTTPAAAPRAVASARGSA